MFCGFFHPKACACDLCRTVGKGYIIPRHGRRVRNDKPQYRKENMKVPSKASANLQAAKAVVVFDDKAFSEMYPSLVGYLSCDRFDDGSPRQTATLLLFFESGGLKVCLNDRHLSRSAFVTAPNFAEVMDTLESGLTNDTLEWRVKSQQTRGNGYTPF